MARLSRLEKALSDRLNLITLIDFKRGEKSVKKLQLFFVKKSADFAGFSRKMCDVWPFEEARAKDYGFCYVVAQKLHH